MSDLIGVNDTLPVRLGGVSSSSGLPDNYADVNAGGSLQIAGQGTAGTPAGGVVSVQGVSGGTAQPVSQSAGPWTINLTEISGSAIALGQTTMSASLPVAIASDQSAIPVSQNGTWTVQQGTAPWSFIGTLTNNNATPSTNNLGALVALAEGTLSSSRYTTGDQVLLVTDLAGNTNIDLQYYLGSAISKTNPIATTISDGTNVITAAISAYGTPPTGTEVMGVNAYITNIPTVNQGTSPWITKDQSDGPVTPGTVASFSQLIGGQYNTTLPTLTNTEQAAIQLDSNGCVLVSQPTASVLNAQVVGNVASGAADSGNPIKTGGVFTSTLPTVTTGERVNTQTNQFGETTIQYRNKYLHITTSGTTVVKSGSGRLHGISFSQNSGITVTVYDNTAASGTTIALFESQTMTFVGPLGCEFSTGLTINQSGANNITVYYQ